LLKKDIKHKIAEKLFKKGYALKYHKSNLMKAKENIVGETV